MIPALFASLFGFLFNLLKTASATLLLNLLNLHINKMFILYILLSACLVYKSLVSCCSFFIFQTLSSFNKINKKTNFKKVGLSINYLFKILLIFSLIPSA